MSTPFDKEAVDMLDSLGVKAFKVASCDITNFPLLSTNCKEKQTDILIYWSISYERDRVL